MVDSAMSTCVTHLTKTMEMILTKFTMRLLSSMLDYSEGVSGVSNDSYPTKILAAPSNCSFLNISKYFP